MRRCYFDFGDTVKTNATGYFPYTPPMSLLRGLRASLDRIFDEGLENIFARHTFLAEGSDKLYPLGDFLFVLKNLNGILTP